MDTQSVSQALVTCFLALGQAVGEEKLLEAGKHLRDAMNSRTIDRGAARILQSVLAGIDYRSGAAA
jgi:hypothetical protein